MTNRTIPSPRRREPDAFSAREDNRAGKVAVAAKVWGKESLMKKRVLWLGLILVSTVLSQGCYCCHRPFFFQRWQYMHGDACCSTSCATPGCCGTVGSDVYLGAPLPSGPASGPLMPGAMPLTRAQFNQK